MVNLDIEIALISRSSRSGNTLTEEKRNQCLFVLQQAYPSLDSAEICIALEESKDLLVMIEAIMNDNEAV